VDGERAEAYLRTLAEGELRRAVAGPWDSAVAAECSARVQRAAQILAAVHALEVQVIDQILDDFELPLGTRQAGSPGQQGAGLRSLMRPPPSQVRRRERLMNSPAAAAAGHIRRPGRAGSQTAPCRVVPAGQRVPFGGEDGGGEICILSYAHTAAGARLTMAVRPHSQSGPAPGPCPPAPGTSRAAQPGMPPARHAPSWMLPFHQFTATDDRGIIYQMGTHCSGGGPRDWVLRLHPEPPPDLRWLDLATTPGQPAVRIDLTRLPDTGPATAGTAALSPGELLLDTVAMRLLAQAPAIPRHGIPLDVAGLRLTAVADGLGDVIVALRACGALSPDSPVPGQLAALCAHLNVGGHGITTPPDDHLPEPWRSVLAQSARPPAGPAPETDGYAAAAVTLPDFDGLRLAILGLRNSGDGTLVHATWHPARRPLEPDFSPAIWIHDSGGHWHATRPGDRACGIYGDTTMSLEMTPPLSSTATWIEVLAAGPSAQAKTTLPLHWE
jgi:hypothetical protein